MLEFLNPANALGAVGTYLQAGGPVVVAILIFTFVMWALIIERLIYLATWQPQLARAKQAAWNARQDHASWYAHAIRDRLISELRLESERFLGVIKVLILITPLLGLLGTVTGMIEVFQVITDTGSSDARLMASGISRATIPTMTGLAVSLSGVLFINLLNKRVSQSVAGFADTLDIHARPTAGQEQPA
jgi:biopolymer transport protein ExbB